VFPFFDTLTDKYSLEKIRTIGDNYMVASGVPKSRDDHATALANMPLDMNAYIATSPMGPHLSNSELV
jgi:guanylate cyclase